LKLIRLPLPLFTSSDGSVVVFHIRSDSLGGVEWSGADTNPQFESLLDDVVHMSDSDVMYAFTKVLQPRLKEWVLHDRPETLQAAFEIVVRMSGSDESHTSASSQQAPSSSPMDVDRIAAALSRLEMGNKPHNFTKNNNYNKSHRTHYDPRKDSRWQNGPHACQTLKLNGADMNTGAFYV